MARRARQLRILDLVEKESIHSQDQLRRRLARLGLRVTQATLSRDCKELGLVRTAGGYARPSQIEAAPPQPPLNHLLREFVLDVRAAQNLLVLQTTPGSAAPVAAALDGEKWREVVGTVAGDDTVLVVTSTRSASDRVGKKIRQLAA